MLTPSISRSESSRRTREAIASAAAERFTEYGAASVTMGEVADLVGISRPGLLKHFPDKRALVDVVAVAFAEKAAACAEGSTGPVEAAERWRSGLPGYASSSTFLLHEALTREPETREKPALHHRWLSSSWAEVSDDSVALHAGWEGLQILSQYVSGVDPVQVLSTRLRSGRPDTWSAAPIVSPMPVPLGAVFVEPVGYASGRARRTQILRDASELFAAHGYHGTTMRSLAERVSVSPSTLLHHFRDKEGLLAEVLRFRDLGMVRRRDRVGEVLDAVEDLEQLGREARRDEAEEPGLISLYAVLSTEAVAPSHPAHEYFRDRFERTISYFENLFARAAADLQVPLDPRFEAVWLVGMWDGLQFRHLLSLSVDNDLAERLEAHISQVLMRQP